MRLASGQTVKLSGLRLPDDEPQAKAAHALLACFGDALLAVGAAASAPDRWGRLPAVVTATTDAGAVDLNRALVAAGLALVDAGEADRLCQAGASRRRGSGAGLGPWSLARSSAISRWLRTTRTAEGARRPVRPHRGPGPLGRRAAAAHLPQFRSRLGHRPDHHHSETNLADHARPRRHRGAICAGAGCGPGAWSRSGEGPAITIMAPEMLEILDGESPRRP